MSGQCSKIRELLSPYIDSRVSPDERRAVDEAVRQAGDAVNVWMELGADAAMNRFNGSRQNRADGPTEQG